MKTLYAGGPSTNKNFFAGAPPAKKKLFSGGPLVNKKLFAKGLLTNYNLFTRDLSILYSPERSCTVLFSLPLYTMILYSLVRPFKVLYCCITLLSSLVLFAHARFCIAFFGPVQFIGFCNALPCMILFEIVQFWEVLYIL